MAVNTYLPALAVLIPLAGALLILVLPEDKYRERAVAALLTVSLNLIVVLSLLPPVMQGQLPQSPPLRLLPNLELTLRADPLSMAFALVAGSLWIFAIIYSLGYMKGEGGQGRYFFYYILSMSATMGVAFSGNLFSLYVFFEYLTLCTYPLVIHSGSTEAFKSGTRYIIYCLSGGGLILAAFFALQSLVPGAAFEPGGSLAPFLEGNRTMLAGAFLLLVAGFAVKAAVIPLHAWLPGAMVAPAPVSALLHAVAVVKSGAFGVIRVLYFIYNPAVIESLGLQDILAVLVSLSILLGSILALRQSVLKLRLAYSTIGQLGYIILGALLLTPAGLTGGILHLINHAFLKITLFFCAGQILKETGKSRLEELYGVGRRLPLTMACFSLAGLGLIGILPLNAFISKYYLIQGSLGGGKTVFAFVILASALLNAAYYLPVMVNAYFRQGTFTRPGGWETSPAMLIPTIILTACCFALGLFAHELSIPLAEKVIAHVF